MRQARDMSRDIKSVGLAPNPQKQEAVQLTAELIAWLERNKLQARVIKEVAPSIGRDDLGANDEEVASSDLLVVVGGDGTMLRWCRLAGPKNVPMLGINFGQYGFITEVAPAYAIESLEKTISGTAKISERVVLKADHIRQGKVVASYQALNDVVVSSAKRARMLNIDTFVNDQFLVTYAADGIIVSTPTGSTAYSLSAGGPVVHPNVGVFIITPICPHTLSERSLVIPDKETVQIIGECGQSDTEMLLTVDGQVGDTLHTSDTITVAKADYHAKLVEVEPLSFYHKLRTRLHWGERFTD